MQMIITQILYILLQCTWGLPQTLAGFCYFLINIRHPHHFFHGSVVTEVYGNMCVSLGMFVFVASDRGPIERTPDGMPDNSLFRRLMVHEYGHTIQSIILGPLYLFIIGIPSAIWCNLSYFQKQRAENNKSYYSFYTENHANILGEKVTGEKAMGTL